MKRYLLHLPRSQAVRSHWLPQQCQVGLGFRMILKHSTELVHMLAALECISARLQHEHSVHIVVGCLDLTMIRCQQSRLQTGQASSVLPAQMLKRMQNHVFSSARPERSQAPGAGGHSVISAAAASAVLNQQQAATSLLPNTLNQRPPGFVQPGQFPGVAPRPRPPAAADASPPLPSRPPPEVEADFNALLEEKGVRCPLACHLPGMLCASLGALAMLDCCLTYDVVGSILHAGIRSV